MNNMRKLMEAVEKLDEYSSIANDEAEQHLEQAAKALAKDAVLQASGVYDDEGPGRSGAKSGNEYIHHAAPKFLDDEYKGEIMNAFQQYFDEYVQYFLEYVGSNESIEEGFKSDLDIQKDAAANELADIIAGKVISVMRSRPEGEKHREGMTNYIMKGEFEDLRRRVDSMVDQRLRDE